MEGGSLFLAGVRIVKKHRKNRFFRIENKAPVSQQLLFVFILQHWKTRHPFQQYGGFDLLALLQRQVPRVSCPPGQKAFFQPIAFQNGTAVAVAFHVPEPMNKLYSLPPLIGGAKALSLTEQLSHHKTGFAGVVIFYKKSPCITGAFNGNLIFPRVEPSIYRELVYPGMPMPCPPGAMMDELSVQVQSAIGAPCKSKGESDIFCLFFCKSYRGKETCE